MKPILQALAVAVPLAGIATGASATFKPTSDFDGDGRSDVGWRNYSSGADTAWLAANSATRLSMPSVVNTNWFVVGSADFDGDGRADVVWRNVDTLANVVWKSGNSNAREQLVTVTDGNWSIAGFGDFDGDGKSDILWRASDTGDNWIWPAANSAAVMRAARALTVPRASGAALPLPPRPAFARTPAATPARSSLCRRPQAMPAVSAPFSA